MFLALVLLCGCSGAGKIKTDIKNSSKELTEKLKETHKVLAVGVTRTKMETLRKEIDYEIDQLRKNINLSSKAPKLNSLLIDLGLIIINSELVLPTHYSKPSTDPEDSNYYILWEKCPEAKKPMSEGGVLFDDNTVNVNAATSLYLELSSRKIEEVLTELKDPEVK